MGLPNILKAMRLLREQPSFRFTLDQVAYVRPFLERYPSEEADFRRFLAEGRLQLAGGLDVMPDVNMPGGETFIRQMQYGKGYYRDKLGVDVTAGWLIDTFGHHAQMPQLMAQAGYKSYWFVRGVPNRITPPSFSGKGSTALGLPRTTCPIVTQSCTDLRMTRRGSRHSPRSDSTACRPTLVGRIGSVSRAPTSASRRNIWRR